MAEYLCKNHVTSFILQVPWTYSLYKRHIYKEDQLLNQDDRPTDQWVVGSLEFIYIYVISLAVFLESVSVATARRGGPTLGTNIPPFVSSTDVNICLDSDVCSLGLSFKCKCERKKENHPSKLLVFGQLMHFSHAEQTKWQVKSELKKTKPNWINDLLLKID